MLLLQLLQRLHQAEMAVAQLQLQQQPLRPHKVAPTIRCIGMSLQHDIECNCDVAGRTCCTSVSHH